MSGIKYGNIQGPEGGWLGITYGTGNSIIFLEPVLEMTLGKTQLA